ncbi:uncharacterized protein LOC142776946 [Rhipicephalus microplus]|uniref:uncharacterized protein LOC142776946 n=1 Tax=Rhipicephalus microplus TaxID=6941 RepID=UPI003F6BDD7E
MFSDASVGSAASPTPLFDRQQRKRVAFIGTVLEAGRIPVLHVGHSYVLPSPALRDLRGIYRHFTGGRENAGLGRGSQLHPAFHRSSVPATAEAWEVDSGPTSLRAAFWAVLRWLLSWRESHAAAQCEASVASSNFGA